MVRTYLRPGLPAPPGATAQGTHAPVRANEHFAGSPRILPALLALLIAAATYVIGRRRERALRGRPLPRPLAPRREVRWIGASAIVLIVVSALALPV